MQYERNILRLAQIGNRRVLCHHYPQRKATGCIQDVSSLLEPKRFPSPEAMMTMPIWVMNSSACLLYSEESDM